MEHFSCWEIMVKCKMTRREGHSDFSWHVSALFSHNQQRRRSHLISSVSSRKERKQLSVSGTLLNLSACRERVLFRFAFSVHSHVTQLHKQYLHKQYSSRKHLWTSRFFLWLSKEVNSGWSNKYSIVTALFQQQVGEPPRIKINSYSGLLFCIQ